MATRPVITSPSLAILPRGRPGVFTIATDGTPRPAISLSGRLPAGLAFEDRGDGTATISGTPSGRARPATVVVTATSRAGAATQELHVSVTLRHGACANLVDGTAGPDTLRGSTAGDRLLGLDGDDLLVGRSARDCLLGSLGADTLRGGRGGDTVDGGAGDDLIVGGAGRDIIRGRSGDDVIRSRDQQVDRIRCGSGEDRVLADPQDELTGCELVD